MGRGGLTLCARVRGCCASRESAESERRGCRESEEWELSRSSLDWGNKPTAARRAPASGWMRVSEAGQAARRRGAQQQDWAEFRRDARRHPGPAALGPRGSARGEPPPWRRRRATHPASELLSTTGSGCGWPSRTCLGVYWVKATSSSLSSSSSWAASMADSSPPPPCPASACRAAAAAPNFFGRGNIPAAAIAAASTGSIAGDVSSPTLPQRLGRRNLARKLHFFATLLAHVTTSFVRLQACCSIMLQN